MSSSIVEPISEYASAAFGMNTEQQIITIMRTVFFPLTPILSTVRRQKNSTIGLISLEVVVNDLTCYSSLLILNS